MPGSPLVPGYPAIADPTLQNSGAASGGAYPTPVTPAELGAAVGTYNFGGTLHVGDVFTFVINGHSNTYAVVSGDTTETLLAAHIAAAINGDSTDSAIVSAAGGVGIVTVTAKINGTPGCYSFAGSFAGGNLDTVAVSGPALFFGSGSIIVPKSTFQWNFGNGNIFTYYEGYQYTIDLVNAAAMRSLGLAF